MIALPPSFMEEDRNPWLSKIAYDMQLYFKHNMSMEA
jgi:hypothetical protein